MKRRYPRIIIVALTTCIVAGAVDYLSGLETAVGLDALFKLRGSRPPPVEVVVVAMDEISESRLGVGQDLTRWRGFHAGLVKTLRGQGAALIIFDLQFIVSHPEHDPAFAAAMREAGNVLLIDCVQKLRRGVEDFYGREECSERNREPFVSKDGGAGQPLSEQLIAMRKIPPTPVLARSALDHTPFYLTNDADSPIVREGWTFIDALAEAPALPVLAWLYYLQRSGSLQGIIAPDTVLSVWLTGQRRQCRSAQNREAAGNKASFVSSSSQASPSGEGTESSFINSAAYKTPARSALAIRIDNVICLEDSRYLDFYGPPQTLRMESYSDVYDGKVTALQGKVVFVGKANRRFSPGKTDFFQTPYTDTRSGKMAGVEIMATQFANLLEGRFVTSPLPPAPVLLLFGLLTGLLLVRFAGVAGILVSLSFGGVYAGFALWCFNRYSLWLPVAAPLLIQLPLSWLMALLWSRRDLLQERKRILNFVRRVFPQWIPFVSSSPGQWYPEQGARYLTSERDVNGLCLATDIEGYTSIAARNTPHQMWSLLNAYYQVLGHPVISHHGVIADVTGDAMMAVWIDTPGAGRRLAACSAALEIALAVDRFNEASRLGSLSTRIGLHEGDMTLGRLDVGGSSHYRAIGDTVNIASRIQGVNKYLGTRILASANVALSLTGVVYRPVGVFRVKGRVEPLALIEIIGREADAMMSDYLYQAFADGLRAFQSGQWQDAIACFQTLLDRYENDGPSRFYLDLALAYQAKPVPDWDGVVTLEGK